MVREEMPTWSAQEQAEFKAATGISSPEAAASKAQACMGALCCADYGACRRGEAQAKRTIECALFLKALSEFVDDDGLLLFNTETDRHGCPQIPIPDLEPAPLTRPDLTQGFVEQCKVIDALFDGGPYWIGGECVRFKGLL